MILSGKLVILRPLTKSDAEITLKWRQSDRAKFMQQGAQTVKDQRNWIASKENADELNFIMEYRTRPVGMIALTDINHLHKSAVLGRLLIGEKEFVGNAPAAFEAELLVSDYFFDVLKFHKLYGEIMANNIAMINTRKYLGYHQDGLLRHHYLVDGVYRDALAVSILEDEYRAVTRSRLVGLIGLFDKFSGMPA